MKNTNISENDVDYKRKVERVQRIGAVCACLIIAGVFSYFYIHF